MVTPVFAIRLTLGTGLASVYCEEFVGSINSSISLGNAIALILVSEILGASASLDPIVERIKCLMEEEDAIALMDTIETS